MTAATSVVWSAELTAFSMMFFSAYIGAPPTIGFSASAAGSATEEEGRAAASARRIGMRDIRALPWLQPRIARNGPLRQP